MSDENKKQVEAPPPPEQKPVVQQPNMGESAAAKEAKALAGQIAQGNFYKDSRKLNEELTTDQAGNASVAVHGLANAAADAGMISGDAATGAGALSSILHAILDDSQKDKPETNKRLKRNARGEIELVEEEDNADGYTQLPKGKQYEPLTKAQKDAQEASAKNTGAKPENNTGIKSGGNAAPEIDGELFAKLQRAQAQVAAEQQRMREQPNAMSPPRFGGFGSNGGQDRRDDD